MTAPAPGPQSASLTTAVESLALQVNRDTVLQAREVLLSEALRLKEAIRTGAYDTGVGLCGGDPVSADASAAFNERIGTLVGHCEQYANELEVGAERLGQTALNYGFTEAEIASSFSR